MLMVVGMASTHSIKLTLEASSWRQIIKCFIPVSILQLSSLVSSLSHLHTHSFSSMQLNTLKSDVLGNFRQTFQKVLQHEKHLFVVFVCFSSNFALETEGSWYWRYWFFVVVFCFLNYQLLVMQSLVHSSINFWWHQKFHLCFPLQKLHCW